MGNALGDGKSKDTNSTQDDDAQKSFADKYREELRKDIDELGLDDENEEETTEETEGGKTDEDGGEGETLEDEEEYVSSKDVLEDL